MAVRIINADVMDGLSQIPDESVHCVVTSPPYWGLRDYGTGQWEGGDAECDHSIGRRNHSDEKQSTSSGASHDSLAGKNECRKCGARRVDAQVGLEPTLAEHIQRLVEVFEEVRRVLRKDGVLFLNYGDAYTSGGRSTFRSSASENKGHDIQNDLPRPNTPNGLKPKDLMLIPHRLAIALQDAGWWVRSDIIWHKPNPMPESVTDRPTNAHEHVFLLTKSAKYHWDAEAVREPAIRAGEIPGGNYGGMGKEHHKANRWSSGFGGHIAGEVPAGRNMRNVLTIATHAFSAAHFATFPPKLVTVLLKAGCPERVCSECGAPWMREVERGSKPARAERTANGKALTSPRQDVNSWNENDGRGFVPVTSKTLGFSPSCECQAEMSPGVVLDPFGGSGTVGLVADQMRRDAILIELNPEYAEMARGRISGAAPLFAEVS